MAKQKDEKLDIEVGEVVRYGEEKAIGVIMEIRIIDTAKFVQKFCGDTEEVMVRIRTSLGTALIWPKQHEIFKVSEHDAKEFKLKLKRSEDGK